MNGLVLISWLPKTSSSTGAVSPVIRAIASMTPVVMPPMAVGQHDLQRSVRHFGTPSAQGRLAQLVRHELEHLLGGAHHDRHHQDRQRQRAGEARVAEAQDDDPERQDEQARDDRRDAGHHVDEEGDDLRQRAAPVLDQVDRGEQADRHRDDGGDADLLERADDGVVDAAARAGGDHPGHRVGQEVAVEDLRRPCRRWSRPASTAGSRRATKQAQTRLVATRSLAWRRPSTAAVTP